MKKILDIIKEYQIYSYKDLLKLENRLPYLLNDIGKTYSSIESEIKPSTHGLNFNIKLNKHTTTSLTQRHLGNLTKKASIYSSKTILEIPAIYFDIEKGSGIDYHRLRKSKEYRIKKSKQFFNTFIAPFIKLEEAISANMVEIYPKSMEFPIVKPRFYSKKITPKNKDEVKKITKKGYQKLERFKLEKTISDDFIDLFTKKKELLEQLIEDKINLKKPSQLNLYLPHINGIDFNTWTKIKEDHEEVFKNFHIKANLLFKNSSSNSSEHKVLDIMKEVDYEVRQLNVLFKQLEKSKKLNSYKIISGVSLMALNLIVNTDFAESLLDIIGGSSIFSGVWGISTKRSNINKFKKEDFFIPWYLNSQNTAHNKSYTQ